MSIIPLSCNLSALQSISKHVIVVSSILLDFKIHTHCPTCWWYGMNLISTSVDQNTHSVWTWGVKIVSIDVSFYYCWVGVSKILTLDSNLNVLSYKLSEMRKLKERFVEEMASALMHDFFNRLRRSNLFEDAGWSFDSLFWLLFFGLKLLGFIAWSWLILWTFLFIFLVRILLFNVIFLLFSIFHLNFQ